MILYKAAQPVTNLLDLYDNVHQIFLFSMYIR